MSDDRPKRGAEGDAEPANEEKSALDLNAPAIPKAPRAPQFDESELGPPISKPTAAATDATDEPASDDVAAQSAVRASSRPLAPLRPEGAVSDRPPASSPRARPSRPPHRDDTVSLHEPRDRFAVGLVLPVMIAAFIAHVMGGILSPGYKGVAGEKTVATLERWGTITPMMAAVLGVGTIIALVMAAVANPRMGYSTRIVATFGAGLSLTFVAWALRVPLEPQQLLVLFAGAFAVLMASAVESIGPPATRALGLLFALLALTALLRIGAWGLGWRAAHDHTKLSSWRWGQYLSAAALVVELTAQALTCVYLAFRPGYRGAVAALVGAGAAFALASWTIHTPFVADGSGGFRQALQHAITLRVQATSGPPPAWLSRHAALDEIPMLDDASRNSLLPLVFAEIASFTIPLAALASARVPTLASMAAIGLAILSRGQVDTPLRAVELVVAALCALVLSRGARVRFATTARGSERPPDRRGG